MSKPFLYSDRETRINVPYRLEPHYRIDLEAAYETLPPPQRGAAMSTAAKHAKLTVIRTWLESIAIREELDMTPIMAAYLVPAFLGRNVSNRELMKWFGVEDRTAATKSPDITPETVQRLIETYQDDVQAELDDLVTQMGNMRDSYKKELKQREKDEGRKITTW